MSWTVRKQVLCPACDDVLGEVVHRWWPGMLTVHDPAGYELMPRRSGAVERDLNAGTLSGVADQQALREMLRAHHADLVYTLTCRAGIAPFAPARNWCGRCAGPAAGGRV